jgi:hypothetical protein
LHPRNAGSAAVRGRLGALLLHALSETSWKRFITFAIFIIIQPIFVNVIDSLGERAAGSKKRKDDGAYPQSA